MEVTALIGTVRTVRQTLDHDASQLTGKIAARLRGTPDEDYFLNICADFRICADKLAAVEESLKDWNSRFGREFA